MDLVVESESEPESFTDIAQLGTAAHQLVIGLNDDQLGEIALKGPTS
ncbi:MAG: hypothetical protein ABI345_08515 [Jatrophihabitans sp.]